MGAPPQALLLDFGGTLAYDRTGAPLFQDMYRRALGLHGLTPSLDTVEAAVQAVWGETMAVGAYPPGACESEAAYIAFVKGMHVACLGRLGVGDSGLAAAIAAAIIAQDHDATRWQPFEDALEVLPVLAQRYRLVLVSNFHWGLHDAVAHSGLAPFFQAVVCSAHVG